MSEYICETCQREIEDDESYYKYCDNVVQCDDCRQHILHDMGKTGV